MLNADVHDKFSNHQYQTLIDGERGTYSTRSECSIFFEIDGPYRCMFLPASTEEGKLLKKRYAVFNDDKSLAELKGFELKRRGELELIKTFQSQVFERFLDGSTLQECYESAAEVANHWIDVIDTRGESLGDDELIDLISENRSMSRQLDDYGDQKGTSQTTARRLGEFLGADIIKDKGLNCKFIIAEQPYGAPVTERAIPTAIWRAESSVMKHFLRKWLKSPGLDGDALDIRNVLDWDYYLDRLGKTIQKIITIPAALQKVANPVPRVAHPQWLESTVRRLSDKLQQKNIKAMFGAKHAVTIETAKSASVDIEDIGAVTPRPKIPTVHNRRRHKEDDKSIPDESAACQDRIELTRENVSAWIFQKKSKWRKARRDKRTESGGIGKKARNAVSVEGFVREAALSLSQREWHVVEVRGSSMLSSLEHSKASLSGEFTVWVMFGDNSLQKIKIQVPRIVYVSTQKEIRSHSEDITSIRKVEKHLPHGGKSQFLYEVEMPEYVFRKQDWTHGLAPVDGSDVSGDLFETLYESSNPLMTKLLAEMGAVAKLEQSAASDKGKRSYSLADLSFVERPSEGEYLNSAMSYKRIFLYTRIHPKSKTGIVALYFIDGGSGSFAKKSQSETDSNAHFDITRPSSAPPSSFDVGASCLMWVVKPGSRGAQRNVTQKQCESLFVQLLDTIQEAANLESEYASVSPASDVRVASIKFVDTEELAFAAANEAINTQSKSNHGPTFLLLNSNRPKTQLRRFFSTFNSMPVIPMPFPPGPAHNPSMSTLPSLNWEQPAVQLCFESYLFTLIIAFPKRVSYARYGHIPVGNLDEDEHKTVYDVGLTRLIRKNRTLSWATPASGRSDLGVGFLPSSEGRGFRTADTSAMQHNQDDLWNDENELVSPVIRRPGCYRCICVDVDIQDLAIAALTEMPASTSGLGMQGNDGGMDPNSPQSVMWNSAAFSSSKFSTTLGDEMSTSVSLPLVRTLVTGWLKDAYASNSFVADEMLHHIYRLLSDSDTLLYDPSLHRIAHALMKSTFIHLLGELQRLGCSIVHGSFNRVTLVTNKISLADAEEYVNFVLSTVRRRASGLSGDGDALARVSLHPRQYHSHFVFLDEFNFGTMQLERVAKTEADGEDFVISDNADDNVIVPSVVTAWSVMNYLGSEMAQEYFRAIIGRFSSDVLKKQMALVTEEDSNAGLRLGENEGRLLAYKKRMISSHFATYLTRAVDEILKDGVDDEIKAPLLSGRRNTSPALDFIKSVTTVLGLDQDVDEEVHALKRSLLSQLGVAEYSEAAKWVNPCPTFILPDVFCPECHDSRDVNLCHIPPRLSDDDAMIQAWACEDCGTPYDPAAIEQRLIALINRKVTRYQLQDLRCTKTNRVATRVLAPFSECSAALKLDISPRDALSEIQLLQNLALLYDLESLKFVTEGLQTSFR